jgi:hypothetical protein
MNFKPILIVCTSILLTTLGFFLYEEFTKEEKVNYSTEEFNKLDSLLTNLKKDISKITPDSVHENRVINITNKYQNYYEQNNNSNDSVRYIILDSVLARHRKIALERNYKLLN